MAGLFNRLQDEIDARNKQDGLSPIDLLDMPEAMASVVNVIIRNNGATLSTISELVGQSPDVTKPLLEDLVDKGFVRVVNVKDQVWYKASFGRKADNSGSSGLWSMLDELTEDLV
jgi:DNA-binding MarR family transcriptional regulator